jgi:hypothetical protein
MYGMKAYLEHLQKHKVVKVVNESVTIVNDEEKNIIKEAERARREFRIAKGWDLNQKLSKSLRSNNNLNRHHC